MSRIVLIEDDAFIREDLRMELAGAGHKVAAYDGGDSALPTILSDPPDVIITDIVMEDGEGMDVIVKIRDHSDILIIAISSNPEYLKYAEALGAHRTILKPFRPNALLHTIAA